MMYIGTLVTQLNLVQNRREQVPIRASVCDQLVCLDNGGFALELTKCAGKPRPSGRTAPNTSAMVKITGHLADTTSMSSQVHLLT